jgi:RNA polymerase sigma-70 factor (ECF subfamily)
MLDIEHSNRTEERQSASRISGLVSLARDGDCDAFGLLYERYVERVYRYLYTHTGRIEDAEDLTQEVFLRAFQGIGAYRDHGAPFSAWLMRIAHNLLIDHYRRKDRLRFVPFDEPVTASLDDPVAEAERDADTATLNGLIGRLSPREKEVISLRFGAGLSIFDTAAAMGKSQCSVKTLQHNAVVRLRRMVQENTTNATDVQIYQ